MASASTAIRAAAARPASIVLRRLRGAAPRAYVPVPTRDGGTRSARRRRARSGSSEDGIEATGMTSVSGSSGSAATGCQTAGMTSVGGPVAAGQAAGLRVRGGARLSSSGTLESPCTFAIRSATVTPSVWLPVGAGLLDVLGFGSAAALPRRGAWRWPWTSGKPLIVARIRRPRQPGRARSGVVAVTHVPTGLRLLTIVRVGAHRHTQCLCLPLVRVAALCGLRHWSQIRQDPYRTETS